MGRITSNAFFQTIHDYFKIYLPQQRNCSNNTIVAYQTSMNQLLDYVKKQYQLQLRDISFDTIDSRIISNFLDYLEEDCGLSVSSRIQKQQALRSFFEYAASVDTTVNALYLSICRIPIKKRPDKKLVNYLSEGAIEKILATPDASDKKGLRDQMILILLYDTGARVQEIVNLQVRDLKIDVKTPTVHLYGKGRKHRTVPLMKETVEHLKRYLSIFHSDANHYSEEPLFYSIRRKNRNPISDDTIRILLQKYSDKARTECNEIPEKIHPHMLRHSRAMHLYQHGMDLMLISQWLGHEQVTTTLIYAHADTEMKRAAIEAAKVGILLPNKIVDKYDVNDESVLKKLYGLKNN